MKTRVISFMYLLFFSVIVGGLFFTPTATASTISATVDIEPDKINLFDSSDRWDSPWVSAFIKFPKPYKKSFAI